MATKLDMEFVKKGMSASHDFIYTLVREIKRLEAYCEALESRLTPEQAQEASKEASDKL